MNYFSSNKIFNQNFKKLNLINTNINRGALSNSQNSIFRQNSFSFCEKINNCVKEFIVKSQIQIPLKIT